MSTKPLVATALAFALLGVAACGGGGGSQASATTAATSTPTTDTSATGSASTGPSAGPSTGPSASASEPKAVVGLPADFPARREVPVVGGVVTSATGGKGEDGKIGYVVELSTVGSRQACFDRAAAALVAHGYTRRGEMTAQDTLQAQFTTTKWAVVISSRADGANCQLGYEVGQLTE